MYLLGTKNTFPYRVRYTFRGYKLRILLLNVTSYGKILAVYISQIFYIYIKIYVYKSNNAIIFALELHIRYFASIQNMQVQYNVYGINCSVMYKTSE